MSAEIETKPKKFANINVAALRPGAKSPIPKKSQEPTLPTSELFERPVISSVKHRRPKSLKHSIFDLTKNDLSSSNEDEKSVNEFSTGNVIDQNSLLYHLTNNQNNQRRSSHVNHPSVVEAASQKKVTSNPFIEQIQSAQQTNPEEQFKLQKISYSNSENKEQEVIQENNVTEDKKSQGEETKLKITKEDNIEPQNQGEMNVLDVIPVMDNLRRPSHETHPSVAVAASQKRVSASPLKQGPLIQPHHPNHPPSVYGLNQAEIVQGGISYWENTGKFPEVDEVQWDQHHKMRQVLDSLKTDKDGNYVDEKTSHSETNVNKNGDNIDNNNTDNLSINIGSNNNKENTNNIEYNSNNNDNNFFPKSSVDDSLLPSPKNNIDDDTNVKKHPVNPTMIVHNPETLTSENVAHMDAQFNKMYLFNNKSMATHSVVSSTLAVGDKSDYTRDIDNENENDNQSNNINSSSASASLSSIPFSQDGHLSSYNTDNSESLYINNQKFKNIDSLRIEYEHLLDDYKVISKELHQLKTEKEENKLLLLKSTNDLELSSNKIQELEKTVNELKKEIETNQMNNKKKEEEEKIKGLNRTNETEYINKLNTEKENYKNLINNEKNEWKTQHEHDYNHKLLLLETKYKEESLSNSNNNQKIIDNLNNEIINLKQELLELKNHYLNNNNNNNGLQYQYYSNNNENNQENNNENSALLGDYKNQGSMHEKPESKVPRKNSNTDGSSSSWCCGIICCNRICGI